MSVSVCAYEGLTRNPISGQHCSKLNSTLDDYNIITDPLSPVDEGTVINISCRADYVNQESTTSTAECRSGTVIRTSTLPLCVISEFSKKKQKNVLTT